MWRKPLYCSKIIDGKYRFCNYKINLLGGPPKGPKAVSYTHLIIGEVCIDWDLHPIQELDKAEQEKISAWKGGKENDLL